MDQVTSPVAYWRLDDTDSSAVGDSSGFANTGAVSGTVTLGVPGLIINDSDTAMQFGGGGVQVPTYSS